MIPDYDYKVLTKMMQEVAEKIDGFVFLEFSLDVSSGDEDFPQPVFNIRIHGNGLHWNEDFDDVIDLIKWMNKLIIRLNRKPNRMMASQDSIGENENAEEGKG